MRHRLTEILDATLHVEDDALPLHGAWIDPDGGRLHYLGADVGGWLSDRVALVNANLATWDGTRWSAETTRAEIESASFDQGGGLDMTALPSLITGPFGNTVSPLMIAAGLRAEALEEAPPHPPEPEADAPAPVELSAEERTRRLETWDEIRGAAVFARDGEVGTVSDIVFDDRAWDPVALVAATPGGTVEIDWSHVRRRVAAGGHFVLSAERAEVGADLPYARDLGAEPV